VVEFHGLQGERSLAVVQRLKRFFHVAHFHENNFSCREAIAPFPSWAYEVLFVNKSLDQADPSRTAPIPHALDAPNDPTSADCGTLRAAHQGRVERRCAT
jgi:hypothetical protein